MSNIKIQSFDGSFYSPLLPQNSASLTTYSNTQTGISATNVQDAIDSCFTSVSNGKSLVASAITDMGVSTGQNDSFQTMSENIKKIDTSSIFASNIQQEELQVNKIGQTSFSINSNNFQGIKKSSDKRKKLQSFLPVILGINNTSTVNYTTEKIIFNKDSNIFSSWNTTPSGKTQYSYNIFEDYILITINFPIPYQSYFLDSVKIQTSYNQYGYPFVFI